MFFGVPVCPVIFKTGIPVLKITGQTGSPKIPEKNMFFDVFCTKMFEKMCFLMFFLLKNDNFPFEK